MEFADFALAVKPTYAIPFASNNCYLHPETEQFNKYLNLGVRVKAYFDQHGITDPQCVVCAPGDGWNDEKGFILSEKDWYTSLDEHIQAYKKDKLPTITDAMRREDQIVLKETTVLRYAKQLFSGTPFFIRRLFRGKPITLVVHSKSGDAAYELDIFNRRCRRLQSWNDAENPIQIHARASVFVMCILQVNWNSLGISKRVRFRVHDEDRKIITYFTELNDLFDCEVLPLSKSSNLRFIGTWMRRYREIGLYLQILVDLARGSDFAYRNYLPNAKPAVTFAVQQHRSA